MENTPQAEQSPIPLATPGVNMSNQQEQQQHNENTNASASANANAGSGGGVDNNLAHQLSTESAKIQVELERLKMRRRLIEEQRRALAAATPNAANSRHYQQHNNPENSRNINKNTNNVSMFDHHNNENLLSQNNIHDNMSHVHQHEQQQQDLTNIITHPGDLPLGGTKRKPIVGEAVRRRKCTDNPHYQMKEAIRDTLEHDSTVVTGYFVPNPHTSRSGTFSRATRFNVPTGQQKYYLSYDMQQLQGPNCRKDRRVLTASTRGRTGSNVNSHWGDAKGGVAPGPGAYTPRYWFLSGSGGGFVKSGNSRPGSSANSDC